jgi:hypothetical protein
MVFGIFGLEFLKKFPPHGRGGGGARIMYWCIFSLAHFLRILISMCLIKFWDILHLGMINVFSFS